MRVLQPRVGAAACTHALVHARERPHARATCPPRKARERSVDASARGFDRRGNVVYLLENSRNPTFYFRIIIPGETSRLIREFKPEETGVRAVAFASRLAPHHVVVPVPASRGFRILARRVGARSSVSVPLRAGFSGGCRGCGLVSNPSGTPSGQPPARASRVLFERRSPRRGGNLGRAVDAPEAAVR